MTGRQRFLKIAKGQLMGEVFLPFDFNYGWFMEETLERWRGEGLPRDADLLEFFGFDRVEFTGGKPYGLVPPFEEKVLSEDEETVVVRDESGVTKRIFKHYADSRMPQWLDHPVKSRSDFEELKKRLDPYSPGRFPSDLDQRKETWKSRDYPLGVGPGSFYGHTLQKWVGTEHLCMLFYDDPTFVHEMLDYLEWFFLELLKRLLPDAPVVRALRKGPRDCSEPRLTSEAPPDGQDKRRLEARPLSTGPPDARNERTFESPAEDQDRRSLFDFASFGEDIAFKGRSFMSPETFREFIQPHYVSICELLRSHGIEVIFVDSDGYLGELIPLWMEVGINGFSPLEVAAGMDARALKKEYGKDIVLAGNVDKRALIRGKAEIDREIGKVKELLDLGGYFPAVDHSVPPDVPYGNFQYFLERLSEL